MMLQAKMQPCIARTQLQEEKGSSTHFVRLPGNSRRAKAPAAGQTSPAVHKCSRLEAGRQRRIHLQMKRWLQMKSPQRQRGCRAEGQLSGSPQAD